MFSDIWEERIIEERDKAIDEFSHKLFEVAYEDYESDALIVEYADVVTIAEQMKKEVCV